MEAATNFLHLQFPGQLLIFSACLKEDGLHQFILQRKMPSCSQFLLVIASGLVDILQDITEIGFGLMVQILTTPIAMMQIPMIASTKIRHTMVMAGLQLIVVPLFTICVNHKVSIVHDIIF